MLPAEAVTIQLIYPEMQPQFCLRRSGSVPQLLGTLAGFAGRSYVVWHGIILHQLNFPLLPPPISRNWGRVG